MADSSETYIGKVCQKHPELNGQRGLASRRCRACDRNKASEWRAKNPAMAKAYLDAYLPGWLAKNAEKVREDGAARMQEWRRKNVEKVRAEANSPKMMAYRAARRAKEKRATPPWANSFFIQEAYDIAAVRSRVTGIKWQVDHVVPLQSDKVCGLHWEGNFKVIPAKANSSKGNRHWPDMWGPE